MASGNSPLTPDDIADALRVARERDVAPARLHAQIRAMHEQRSRRPAWRGSGVFAGAFATAVAAVVALVILIAPGGTPGAPTLAQAVALSARGPATTALGPAAGQPGLLDVNIGGIAFPDWAHSYGGWRAVGWRHDLINGRPALTVYYVSKRTARRVAYTIVGGTKIPWPKAPVISEGGLQLRTVFVSGRRVVNWREGDNTCVLSGVGVSPEILRGLASWK